MGVGNLLSRHKMVDTSIELKANGQIYNHRRKIHLDVPVVGPTYLESK